MPLVQCATCLPLLRSLACGCVLSVRHCRRRTSPMLHAAIALSTSVQLMPAIHVHLSPPFSFPPPSVLWRELAVQLCC